MILGRGVFASLVATHGLASFEQHIGAAIIGSYKNTFIHSIISADGSPEAQKLVRNFSCIASLALSLFITRSHIYACFCIEKKLGARRQIPRDFIPVEKAAAKLSPEELEQRFGSWKSVDFRPEAEKGNSPQAGWTKEKFGPYLDGFRGLVSWVSTPFINGHFKKEFGRKFPNFTWGPDKRKIESPDDFIQYLENVEVTTPQELRALRDKVNFVCYVMYGKSHYWAVNAEGIIMEGLGLEYTEELSNGQKMQRRQRGGSIKAIMVKKLGEKTDAIRAKFEEIYLERFYVRDMFSPALVKLKEEKLVPRSMTAGKVTMALFDELDTSALEEKEERRICALFESACKSSSPQVIRAMTFAPNFLTIN